MTLHPYMAGQLAKALHREMLEQAEQRRPARRLGALARAARRARPAERRMRLAVRRALPLRADLEQ
jgi:hypothetical protein